MALSRKETLRRKAEAERKRRCKIRKNPDVLAEVNRKRRARYAKNAIKRDELKKKRSKRAVREQRKKWRIQKKKLKEKQPDSSLSVQAISGRKRYRRRIAKIYYVNSKLEAKNKELKRTAEKYKQRFYRLRDQTSKESNSPNSKLRRELKNCRSSVLREIRRRLLFADALVKDMAVSYSSIKKTSHRKTYRSVIKLRYVKQYRFLQHAKPFYPCEKSPTKILGVKKRKFELIKNCVRDYFENDDVSTLAPGKRDYIVRKKVAKQKRYLNDSLEALYKQFCAKNEYILSFTTFCRMRPFWVVRRNLHQRDTCLCIKHENARFITEQLKRANIVKSGNIRSLIEKEMCCSVPSTVDCLMRTCESCKDKMIHFSSFDGDKHLHYNKWDSKTETNDAGTEYCRTVKIWVYSTQYEVVREFLEMLEPFMKHLGTRKHQYESITKLKEDLTASDILIHADFSENYGLKYSREIQSIHFGANRQHISLHTGMLYSSDRKEAFCTVSEDLRHNPAAILAHLRPILEENRDAKTVHFLTDSPSSQYRNRNMFYLLYHAIRKFFPNLEKLTWNFTESGHGKGAPDGVGGRIKNTCDQMIARDHDISNYDEFLDCVKEKVKHIKIISISKEDMKECYEVWQPRLESAKAIEGTMKCHQVTWTKEDDSVLRFNSLSCFQCAGECQHYSLAEMVYCEEDLDQNDLVLLDELEENHDLASEECDEEIEPVSWEVGDWIVAEFQMEQQKNAVRRFIGKILTIEEEHESFNVTFVRSKITKDLSGYIYAFPIIPDESIINVNQILYKIDPPEKYQREGLMRFPIHCKTI